MTHYPRMVLGAGMLVTFVLGSIHSFSIFIRPLEALLSVSRGQVSLVYSTTLICLTILVLYGYRIYHRAPPSLIVLAACFIAALGIFVAALADEIWQIFVGYSLIFGAANGLGYGFVLQLVSRAMPQQRGFAMGAVTAAYAVGATVFAHVLADFVSPHSPADAFKLLSLVLLLTGGAASILLFYSRVRYSAVGNSTSQDRAQSSQIVLFWAAYGLSVFAGLMAIGHAAGIVQSSQQTNSSNSELAIWGAVLIGAGNALGGFTGGYLSDRISVRALLTTLPLISALCLFVLAVSPAAHFSAGVLSLIGVTYGAIIAVYPYAINFQFGEFEGPRVYGRVFTAWGLAGLFGPLLAGTLYDHTGNYAWPLTVAGCAAILSSTVVIFSSIATVSSDHP